MEYAYYTYQSYQSINAINFAQGPCLATQIPPEIFINICKDLPPIDLLSLAQVCKKFYGYLCSTNSITTQEIWKNSRLTFLPFVQMAPPEGMTELQYVKLVSERGCQFCKKPRIRKVYWAFLVRCCKECLEEKTIRLDQVRHRLLSPNSIPDDMLCGLTFITGFYKSGWDRNPKHRPANLYLIQDVNKVYTEFTRLDVNGKKEWIKLKREEGKRKMEEVSKREAEHENEYWTKTMENSKKRDDRATTIDNFIRQEKNEYGFPRFKMSVVEQCTTYNKAMMSTSTSRFTERAWIGFRNRLIPEYTQLLSILKMRRQEAEQHMEFDVAIQTRQMDIVKMIFELLRPEVEQQSVAQQQSSSSSSDSNHDSDDMNSHNRNQKTSGFNVIFESFLIKYLPWCPSFRNPTFMNKDPRILWDDDFLVSILIPRLREEAFYLKDIPAPITTVCGAFLHGGLNNKRIFSCKLCNNNLQNPAQLYSFFEIRLHLTKSAHKVRIIDDDFMIEVHSSLDNASPAQIFPRNKPEIMPYDKVCPTFKF
ncbi:16149_t:CDS:2 [Funneliformis geosporum]|uniref:16149_t:CDS:1 n=1 Tax=Funneliformis geosporum TaxID=1117311 RepID=A0A9W4X4S4_9GLOM|nr:16149_t:CDS:2 [Funneliformis geosporum]